MGAPTSIGFFGKLPCNGDFLERRMPEGFLEVWDPWLQECVHVSRQALQESWLNFYLTSPIWRFILTSSACGTGTYAGVLAPSVDRVGRYFPLTVVTQIDADESPLEFAVRHNGWFASVEALLIQALEDPHLELAWFDAQIEALTAHLPMTADPQMHTLQRLFAASSFPAQAAWRAPIFAAAELQSSVNSFAFRELHAKLRPVTLWWTDGSTASAPSWLTLRGLPLPTHFAAMLDGQWTRSGWQNVGELDLPPLGAPPLGAPPPASSLGPAVAPAPSAPLRRATFPAGQLTAIESNRAAFIDRPEIGLWAVASAAEPGHDPTALRMLADALQQVGPAGSLTTLVETVRHTLTEVHEQLQRLAVRDVQRIESMAHLIVIAASGTEAALLGAGETQRLRLRGQSLEWLSDAAADDTVATDSAFTDTGSLLDLFESVPRGGEPLGAAGFREMELHYETTLPGDQWILCAGHPLATGDKTQLDALASSGMPLSVPIIVESIPRLSIADQSMPPMITVDL